MTSIGLIISTYEWPEALDFVLSSVAGQSHRPTEVIVADDGWYLSRRTSSEPSTREMSKGTHGYDPELDSMGATLIAWGPAFRAQTNIAPVENVHLYNLFCAMLGLKPAPNDGDNRLVNRVLRR